MGSGSASLRYQPVPVDEGREENGASEGNLLKKYDESTLIRFVEFQAFKSKQCFPRFPDDWSLTSDIKEIDREHALIIFISHAWLRNERYAGSPELPETLVDDQKNSVYNLCVEGVQKILNTHITNEIINCYLWIDYSCLNQNTPETKSYLFEIMEFCDVIFTPIHDVDHKQWKLPPGRMVDYYTEYDSSLWNGCSHAYLKRAACRMEMYYGSNVPLFLGPHRGTNPVIIHKQHNSNNSPKNKQNNSNPTSSTHTSKTTANTITTKKTDSPNNKPKPKTVAVKTVVVSPSGKHNQASTTQKAPQKAPQKPSKSAQNTSSKPVARHFKFRNMLAFYMSRNMRPHVIYGTKESASDSLPIVLPPIQNLMYHLYNPLMGFITNEEDMRNITELCNNYLLSRVNAGTLGHIKYEGQLVHRNGQQPQPHGKGLMRYPNGDFYRGGFLDGQRHGKGRMQFMTGDVYEGDWQFDKIHGFGNYRYNNGHLYEGYWRDNMRDGEGKYYLYPNHWDNAAGTVADSHLAITTEEDAGTLTTETQQNSPTSTGDSAAVGMSRGMLMSDVVSTGTNDRSLRNRNDNSGRYSPSRHNSTVLTVNTDSTAAITVGILYSNTNITSSGSNNVANTANITANGVDSTDANSANISKDEIPPVVEYTVHSAILTALMHSSSSSSNHNSGTNNISNSGNSGSTTITTIATTITPSSSHSGNHGGGDHLYRPVNISTTNTTTNITSNSNTRNNNTTIHRNSNGERRVVFNIHSSHQDPPIRAPTDAEPIVARYEGLWHKDVKHGRGMFIYANGDFYQGDYINDLKQGEGRYVSINGDEYVGSFYRDQCHGRGTLKYRGNGETYTGEFEFDKKHGQGTHRYQNGDIYTGEYQNDFIYGDGTMVYSNREKYAGDWVNETRDGFGTFYYCDGSRYEGHFKGGDPWGTGAMHYPSGSQEEWYNGRKKPFISPKIVFVGALIGGMIAVERTL